MNRKFLSGLALAGAVSLVGRLPAEENVWIATTNGLASFAENWSKKSVPTADDDIVLDGDRSVVQLTWDCGTGGLGDTVASWTQKASYTNRVVMATTRSGTFVCMTVTGDATLEGGRWWRDANLKSDNSTAKVWLNVAVNGNLTVGSGFKFDGYNAGYCKQRGISQGTQQSAGGAHGGLGGSGAYGGGTPYGDLRNPVALGSGCYGSTDNCGGGSVVLNVAGDFVLDGVVTADGGDRTDSAAPSGGSVWIRARTLSGSGTITAEGGSPSGKRCAGGGGRISIQLSDPTLDYAGFKTAFTGVLQARGGFPTTNGSYSRTCGGAGTINVETAADGGRGHLLLLNGNWNPGKGTANFNAETPIADGVTWDLSSLDMQVNGHVVVNAGGTLRLPSFSALTGDGSARARLRFNGGSVESSVAHDKLEAKGFAIESTGTSSFAEYRLVVSESSALTVSGDFTVGSLKLNGVRVEPGDYAASSLAETHSNVSGDGTIHVLGLSDGLDIFVR